MGTWVVVPLRPPKPPWSPIAAGLAPSVTDLANGDVAGADRASLVAGRGLVRPVAVRERVGTDAENQDGPARCPVAVARAIRVPAPAGAASPNPARIAAVAWAEEAADPSTGPASVTRAAHAPRFPVRAPRPHLVGRCLAIQSRLAGASLAVEPRNLALQQYAVVAAVGALMLEVFILLLRVALSLPVLPEVAAAGAVL